MSNFSKSLLIIIAVISASFGLNAAINIEHSPMDENEGMFAAYSDSGGPSLGLLLYKENNIEVYHNNTLKDGYVGTPVKGVGSLLMEQFISLKLPHLAAGEKIRVKKATGSYGHYISQGFIPTAKPHGIAVLKPIFESELADFCNGTLEFAKLDLVAQTMFRVERANKAKRMGREEEAVLSKDVCMINLREETLARVLNYLLMGAPNLDVDDLFVGQKSVSLELVPELRTALKKRRAGMCVL